MQVEQQFRIIFQGRLDYMNMQIRNIRQRYVTLYTARRVHEDMWGGSTIVQERIQEGMRNANFEVIRSAPWKDTTHLGFSSDEREGSSIVEDEKNYQRLPEDSGPDSAKKSTKADKKNNENRERSRKMKRDKR